MNNKITIIVSIFFINIVTIKAADTVYFYPKLATNAIVIDYKKTCTTYKETTGNKIYQFTSNTNKASLTFQFKRSYEKLIYNAYFNDNGKSYNISKKAYTVNQIYTPLCKTEKNFIDSNNNIYTIVSGLCAKPNPKGNPEEDFIMSGFFCVIKIGNDTIENIYPIDDAFVNPDYYILNFASFFSKENGFCFSLANQYPKENKKYFLGHWIIKNGRLKFNKLIETELPSFHIKNNIEYNLMDFLYKENKLAFYMGNAIIDIDKYKEYPLVINNFPVIKFDNIAYGERFDIKFSFCDFIQKENHLHVIYRKNNTFFYDDYLLENGSYKLLNEKEIKQYSVDSLSRFPFFNEDGKILFQIKDKNYFVKLSADKL